MSPRSGFLAVLGAAGLASASATEWIVEVDPLVFALGGFSSHLRLRPGGRWTFGVGGAAGLAIPSALLESGEGWTARVPWALAVSADRSFRPDGDGWSLGLQAGVQHLRSRSETGLVAERDVGFVVPRAGWRWRPFGQGLHLFPWFGVGWTETVHGDRSGPSLPRIVPFGAVHAGWSFGG